MSKLLLQSENRTSGSVHDGTLNATVPIQGEYVLLEFSINDRIFNVSSKNDQVYVKVNSTTDHTLSLTPGYYSLSQLKTELSTQLNTIAGQTFTVTSDSKTGKFTISISGGNNFSLTFGTNKSNSARKVLGFSEVDTSSSSSHTSDLSADLTPYKSIFCRIEEDSKQDINSHEHFYTSLILSGESTFGGPIRYKYGEMYPQVVSFNSPTKKLNYRFHDESNADVDFNGCEWMMLLQKIPH